MQENKNFIRDDIRLDGNDSGNSRDGVYKEYTVLRNI